jgi:N-acyl-D-aspartate/D-glutamate deacylase
MDDRNATTWENQLHGSGGAEGVMISSVINPDLRKYEGKNLAEIGRAMGKDPRDAVMDLVVADRAQSNVIISIMAEDDVRAALKDPLVAVGTDSAAKAEDGPLSENKSHPRGWGSFPRILGKYVRDEHLLTLEEAVRKMTSRPAARVGLTDRGVLRPGMIADVTVFDPVSIHDVATFADPNHYAVGVRWVLVNGGIAVRDGRLRKNVRDAELRGPGWTGRQGGHMRKPAVCGFVVLVAAAVAAQEKAPSRDPASDASGKRQPDRGVDQVVPHG